MDQPSLSAIAGIGWSIIIALFALGILGLANRRLANGNGTNLFEQLKVRLPGCLFVTILLLIAFLTALTIYLMSPVILRGRGGRDASAQDMPTPQPTEASAATIIDPDVSIELISVGDTEPFFGNELYVGVNYVEFDRVTFTVGSPGIPGTRNEGGSNGYAYLYKDDTNGLQYDVRITHINHHTDMVQAAVEFTVTRMRISEP